MSLGVLYGVSSASRDSIAFSVLGEEESFLLRWIAPPVFSCLEYTIERAWSASYRIPDDEQWLEIGKEPGLCNVASSTSYSFTDRAAGILSEGSVQYRLRLRLLSGEEYYVYSEVLTVSLPERIEIIEVYPTPTTQTVSVTLVVPESSTLQFEIFDMVGNRVHALTTGERLRGVHTFNTDISALASGVYVLQIRSATSAASRIIHKTR
jgi:hypothetical protein